MKQLKKYFMYAFAFLVLACSDDDKTIDILLPNVERGAIIRTVNINPNSFNIFDPNSPWTLTMEYQDDENGGLLSSVDVYINFVDNNDFNGNTTSTETLFTTVPASEFSTGPFGLPRATFSLVYQEVLNALGVPNDSNAIFGGDQINVRLVANLTDGRTFTNTDVAANISGGSFFQAPFNYLATIVCPPTVPTPGTWSIEMQDSFGDGWNGASLDITIDGETTNYTFNTGGSASFSFDVPVDTEVISVIFNSGSFDEEISAQVTSANGNVVVDLEPSPAAGVELLDYCLDNL
ncbi:hypothetical protein GTQ34_13935 [Muricauda sp. JGD-17]|uniref:Uncharacterized protein n=1 Tax=Flagellimonas ochracea TaxID=2696472 RepID=A0A964TDU3_9FLAO|nr:hypothetical protein [Allomuricauda ochracea]NAY93020.1 hypothetical protein [Allomuricauda ochracea]